MNNEQIKTLLEAIEKTKEFIIKRFDEHIQEIKNFREKDLIDLQTQEQKEKDDNYNN